MGRLKFDFHTGRDRVVSVGGAPLDLEKLYHVALPRNLCKGLFNIKPLVTWAEATDLPAEDVFVPAMNCVLLRDTVQKSNSIPC